MAAPLLKYSNDYKIITNHSGVRTATKDKYGTALHNSGFNGKLLQPIPDYIRWVNSGELHYLSHEKTEQLARDKPELTDCNIFLPTRILDMFFDIEDDPLYDILHQLALLSWLPIKEVTAYFAEKREKANKSRRNNIPILFRRLLLAFWETWRKHPLYKHNMDELEQICKKENVIFKGPKHAIVKTLALAQGEDIPDDFQADYKGDLSSLPKSISMLKKLSSATLQYILKYHNLSVAGKKDNLVLRVFLLRHERSHLASYMQVREIQDLIKLIQTLILYQLENEILNQPEFYRKKKFSNNVVSQSQVEIPCGISRENLEKLFEPLLIYLKHKTMPTSNKLNKNENTTGDKTQSRSNQEHVQYENYFEVGCNLKIRWTSEEIGDSGWKPGWYSAEVQSSTIEDDEITVVYVSEPDCVYTVEVTPLLAQGKLRI